jgi:AcrR family transcriptional regulator
MTDVLISSKSPFRSDTCSAPVPEGRRERRRAETRERIFRAAMDLFAQRGFFATTVEDITEAADVGKGTFFNYFPSKEHVLSVLHEIQLKKVGQALSAAKSTKQSIHEVLRELVMRVAEEPARSQLLARGLLSTVLSSDAVREMIVDTLDRGREMLGEVLSMGQERGEIRKDLVAEELARGFQHLVLGTVLHWSIGSPADLQERLSNTFETYWAGMAAQTSR